MNDQIDPHFLRLLGVLNQATLQVEEAEKLLLEAQDNLQSFKDIRDKTLSMLNKYYPESSRN